MRIPRADDPRETNFAIAADDSAAALDAAGRLLEEAVGVHWYEEYGSDVDRAALALCRVRRGFAGQRGGPQHGDEAVRELLERASPRRPCGSRAARSRTWTRTASPRPSRSGSPMRSRRL